jgi:hypothetical protein
MGRAGRAFVERCYDLAGLAREYRKILDLAVVSGRDDLPYRARKARG